MPEIGSKRPVLKPQSDEPTHRMAPACNPEFSTSGMSKKAQNEDYFSKMGSANNSRSSDLPPNQGGKYDGFGSSGTCII